MFLTRRRSFYIKCMDFKNRVCETVKKIPRGKVLTYKEVAGLAGSPRAWRAVGNILSKNTDKKIPCHRVIKSDGRLGGYNKGSATKNALLLKEGVLVKKGKIVKT